MSFRVKRRVLEPVFTQALAGQFDAIGVVDDAIEDGVGHGRVSDQRVEVGDRELAGDEYGAAVVTVFDDLQQVAPLIGVESFRTPIVQN